VRKRRRRRRRRRRDYHHRHHHYHHYSFKSRPSTDSLSSSHHHHHYHHDQELGYTFDLAYTSYQSRAIKTLWVILEELNLMWIPEKKVRRGKDEGGRGGGGAGEKNRMI